MKKFHVFIIKIKKYTLPMIFLLFTMCLVIFSDSNLTATKNGISLWATSVVPALLPFFIATELLLQTNMPYILGRFLNIFMKPLFNVSGEGSFAFILGIISGYPVGAKIASDFRKNNILTKVECERLLSFTNNSGPLFIIGTVGISLFKNYDIGLLLLITHILACITVGIIFRFWKYRDYTNNIYKTNKTNFYIQNSNITFTNLGEVLAKSIASAFSTIIMIGGFVIIFSIIISIFNTLYLINGISNLITPVFGFFNIPIEFASGLITGIFEITNGIALISSIQSNNIFINIIFTAFLLGFGGISVLLQVLSVISKTDLSIKPYIIGKLLHGVIAGFYAFLTLQFIPIDIIY